MSDNTVHTAMRKDRVDQMPLWVMLMVGLALGLSSMYFLVARPLSLEMGNLKKEMVSVSASIQELTGLEGSVLDTNSLLSALRSQQTELAQTRVAFQDLVQFRKNVEQECDRAKAGLAQVTHLASLLDATVALGESSLRAQTALDQMDELQNHLLDEEVPTQNARAVLAKMGEVTHLLHQQGADVEQAKLIVQHLGDLQEKLVNQGDGINAARDSLSQLIALRDDVRSGGDDLESVHDTLAELLALNDQLVTDGADAKKATAAAGQLLTLQEQLLSAKKDSAQAAGNLDSLRTLQARLSEGSDQIATALQTLQLLTELDGELHSQVSAMDRMRSRLGEIALLENLVARVTRTLEPLTEMADLGNLSGAEVRAAAQAILDQRNTRLTQNTPKTPVSASHQAKTSHGESVSEPGTSDIVEGPVPFPAEEN